MATTAPKPVAKAPPKGGPQAVPNEPPAQEEVQPATKSKMKRIILISLVMLILGAAGMGGWYMMDQQKDAPASADGADSAKREPIKPPVFLPMDQFTVNLQPDGASDQFLQIAFTLQVGDEAQMELIKQYMPQVRSRLLMLLSSKKASEISTVEGKKKLSEEIMAQVKQPFNAQSSPQSVSNVFFTSFVIQ